MSQDSTARIVAELQRFLASAPPGSKLPSTRTLVARHGASPVTVQKALRLLDAAGLVETRPGVGTFVHPARSAQPADFGWQSAALRATRPGLPLLSSPLRSGAPDAIALHAGYPTADLLPERLVRSGLVRASRAEAAVTRSAASGLPALQAWFARELADGVPTGVAPPTARDVVIVPGSQSGLSSIFRTVVGREQPLLVESPTYWGAILAAAQAGLRLVPVASTPDGPDPADLARAFEETGARAFYAQPNYANPTGAQWSAERSRRILDVVRANDAFLIEDDWAHDFGIDTESRAIAPLDDAGHVIYLRSLTKSLSPAVRIAAVVARGPARDRILADRGAESMYVSEVLQAAAVDVLGQPAWRTHLRSLRQQLRDRRDLLADSLGAAIDSAHVEARPRGGLNLWVRLPDHIDLERLTRDSEARGVLIAPGDEWFPTEPSGQYIRLNFAGPNPDRYPEAAQIIADALDQQRRGEAP